MNSKNITYFDKLPTELYEQILKLAEYRNNFDLVMNYINNHILYNYNLTKNKYNHSLLIINKGATNSYCITYKYHDNILYTDCVRPNYGTQFQLIDDTLNNKVKTLIEFTHFL